MELGAVPFTFSPAGEGAGRRVRGYRDPYRRRLPNIPRTSARPSEEATVRATDFIAASATVSRW